MKAKTNPNVIGKQQFMSELQKTFSKVLGIEVSLAKAYSIFKVCQFLPYQLLNKKKNAKTKVVLAGVGMYKIYVTKTGNKIAKYYDADTTIRIKNKGLDLMQYALNPKPFRALQDSDPAEKIHELIKEFASTKTKDSSEEAKSTKDSKKDTTSKTKAKVEEPKTKAKIEPKAKVEEPKKTAKKIINKPAEELDILDTEIEEPKKVEVSTKAPKKAVSKKLEIEKEIVDDVPEDEFDDFDEDFIL